MEQKDYFDFGKDILSTVSDAIEKNDYSTLSADISGRVKQLTKEVQAENAKAMERRAQAQAAAQARVKAAAKVQRASSGASAYQSSRGGRRKNLVSPFMLVPVSRSKGVFQIVVGAALALGGLSSFFDELIQFFYNGTLSGLIWAAGISAVGVILALKGIGKKKLADRYYQYGQIIGLSEYITIRNLAQATGRTEKQVKKDLLEMKKSGYLPQAKMDDQDTTLMLTQEVYDQYIASEATRRKAMEEQKAEDEALEAAGAPTSEIRALLQEGNAYLRTIKDCNDAIPDKEMSDKLFELEHIMTMIFEQVERQPKSAKELRKFMSYYLPTTTKLLRAYIDLDKQPVNGENITNTKREIEQTMEIINEASKSLLDNMFEDMAMDISSDIHVMTTMMAQDGLTGQTPFDLTNDREIGDVADDVNLTFGTSATAAAASALSSAQAIVGTQSVPSSPNAARSVSPAGAGTTAVAAAPQAQAAEDKQILKF